MATSFSKPFLTKHVFPKQKCDNICPIDKKPVVVVKKDVWIVRKISIGLNKHVLNISSRMNAYKEQDEIRTI
jgi:hypothetical protein